MIGVGNATSTDVVAEQSAVPAADGLPFGIGLMAWALAERPELLDAAIAARPAVQRGRRVNRTWGPAEEQLAEEIRRLAEQQPQPKA